MRDFFLFYTISEEGQIELTFKSFSFLDKNENDFFKIDVNENIKKVVNNLAVKFLNLDIKSPHSSL